MTVEASWESNLNYALKKSKEPPSGLLWCLCKIKISHIHRIRTKVYLQQLGFFWSRKINCGGNSLDFIENLWGILKRRINENQRHFRKKRRLVTGTIINISRGNYVRRNLEIDRFYFCLFVCLFCGISKFVGYLMPNPFLYK